MTVRRLLSMLGTLGVLLGCARENPVFAPYPPPAVPAPKRRFEPGKADPARRAKLEALTPELDRFFEAKRVESGATGLAVGIVLEGELAYARGFGVRDLASNVPVTADTVFRIASMTKSFTALSILKLRDEGRVELDVPAARYLPELAAVTPPTRDSPPISLRMLLTNASGLGFDDLWGRVTFGASQDELRQLLRTGVQSTYAPGTRYEYSNLGWALLGQVVARVSGKPYRAYVRDDVLEPLGMRSSAWHSSEVPAARLAIGYRAGGDKLEPEPTDDDGVFAAGGGLYTSLNDYARYAAYQLSAYPPRDDPESGPVRRSTLREMHQGQRWARGLEKDTPVARRTEDGLWLGAAIYGFGWMTAVSCTEDPRVQHGGFEPGYFSWIVMVPKARVAFIALATTGPAGNAARAGVFDILRRGGVIETTPKTPHPNLAALPEAIASLLATWDRRRFEAIFDADSARYSWNAKLEQRFAELRRVHGSCRPEGELRVHAPLYGEFRVQCERGAMEFEALLAPTTPPRLQHLEIRQRRRPSDASDAVARRIASALGTDEPPPELGPALDRAVVSARLRDLGRVHGTCTLKGGYAETRHEPFETKHSDRYELTCERGSLLLAFSLDDTAALKTLELYPPRAPDATCWP